jgi:uncharacterized membrane protein YraQ (UPF0718 family)
MKIIKRYRFFIVTIIAMIIISIFNIEFGKKALGITFNSFVQIALVIPPIFLLIGLLDVWVPRETMIKYMGEGSGLKGIILAFLLGSAAAGPLHGAFPVAAIFMKKGAKFTNVLIFMGAWSTTKIPMFLFELSALGPKFAITRLLIDIPGIIIIAYAIAMLVPKEEVKRIYKKVEEI